MTPSRPLLPCPDQPCPERSAEGGRCPRHKTLASRADQLARGTSHQRGYDAAHGRWRQDILDRDPWCKDPERRHPGERRASLIADHILPVRAGGTWTLENGQGLCLSCHNAKTARERPR